MFLMREKTSVMDSFNNESEVFGCGLLGKEKITLCDQDLSKAGPRSNNSMECHDPRSITVFLTPPSSPPRDERQQPSLSSCDHRSQFMCENNFIEEEDAFRAWSTKDLRSMLIRDCMWNGYTLQATTTSSGEISTATNNNSRIESPSFREKFRSLTKTPPLVDCNLRITFVDPSEIWPFNIAEQIKAGTPRLNEEDTKTGDSAECADEDVEVDVVGIEAAGASKHAAEQKKKGEPLASTTLPSKRIKDVAKSTPSGQPCTEKAISPSLSTIRQDFENPSSPLTPSTSDDDEYAACKSQRPCAKRKRVDSESCDESGSVVDAKQQQRATSSGDESDVEGEPGRATHNVLERKRRNELKQRFQYLRDSIPEVTGNDRAPKVAILQKAYSYITFLQMEDKRLLEEAQRQRNLNARLLKRLYDLQH